VANDYTGWWVYLAAPVIGAAIADRKELDAAQGVELPP